MAESGAKFELGDRNRDGHVDSVELSNKALLLEVPKKPGRVLEFDVVTPQAIAAVLGTKWAVDAEGAKTSVFVVNGRVSVARSAGRGSVVLGPGDGVDVETAGELIVKRWPPARDSADGKIRTIEDTRMSHRRLHILATLLCTALWAGAIWLGHTSGHLRFLDRLELALTDVRGLVRGVKAPPDLVTIVAIDDAIVKLAGTYPLPRAEIAKIVEAIARLEPKVIAIDLLLVDKGPADGDAALAKSLAARPTVLAAAAVFSNTIQPSAENDGPLARLPKADRFLLPLPAFADRTEVGIANVATRQTGTPLSIPMLFRTSDRIELSFPLRVASVAIGQKLTIEPDRLLFGDRPIATASDYSLPISYYGPRQTIRTVSAANLIDGQIDKEAIQGRIVVLGATATGAGDFFPTPFDSLMPGVEIISTAITHLVAGDSIVRDRPVRIVEAVTTILLPVLLVGLLAWRRNVIGLLTVSAMMLAWAAANAIAFAHGIWLDAATTIAAAAPPVILFGTLQLWSGRSSAQHLAAQNRLLEQFQTPGLQQWLTRDPDFLLAPVRQNAAVVFVDLSGFTSLSETLDPDATRGLF